MPRNFLVVDPAEKPEVLRALASDVRVAILKLLHVAGPLNVNEIANRLEQPQSTISSNMQVLVDAGLVRTETQKAKKGNQKICHSLFDEVLVMFKEDIRPLKSNAVEVAMPLGLYTVVPGERAVRPLLGRRDHRPPRRPRHLPRSRPHEDRADVVHARLCGIPVPQQCAARQAHHHLDGVFASSSARKCRAPAPTGRRTSPFRSTARTSAPGCRPAISATSAASTRRTGGSSKAASTASSRPSGSARSEPSSTA